MTKIPGSDDAYTRTGVEFHTLADLSAYLLDMSLLHS